MQKAEGRLPKKALTIAGKELRSRLFLGTGKFSSPAAMARALEASGAEVSFL